MEATIRDEHALMYLEFATTDARGRFELYDFPAERWWNTNSVGQLNFRHPTALTRDIKDVYALSDLERTNLQVTLDSGHEISGLVTSTNGHPVAHLVVEAVPTDTLAAQRTTTTDIQGRFLIQGLPDSEVSLHAHTAAFDQQARRNVQLAGANAEVNLRLEPVIWKSPPASVSLLGMKLADITPKLQSVYDLDSPTGVLILDPGTKSSRLGMGEMSIGERFWIVGNKEIKNLRQMVAEVLRVDALPKSINPNEGCHGSIRVVYTYRHRGGTNTQWLKLTAEDIAELKRFQLAHNP